jgi:hypothetical protein
MHAPRQGGVHRRKTALIASEEFDGMDSATVARIIRVPRKIRRKKFA